jgi:hypothetical protein
LEYETSVELAFESIAKVVATARSSWPMLA